MTKIPLTELAPMPSGQPLTEPAPLLQVNRNKQGTAGIRKSTQRITRFVETREQTPRDPDSWESEHLRRTLVAVGELDFPRGEQTMMWAEWQPGRRPVDAMAKLKPLHGAVSTKDLRSQLDGPLP